MGVEPNRQVGDSCGNDRAVWRSHTVELEQKGGAAGEKRADGVDFGLEELHEIIIIMNVNLYFS